MRSDVDVVVSELYSPLTNDERFAFSALLAGIGSSLSRRVVIGSIGHQVVCLLREAQIPGDTGLHTLDEDLQLAVCTFVSTVMTDHCCGRFRYISVLLAA